MANTNHKKELYVPECEMESHSQAILQHSRLNIFSKIYNPLSRTKV